MLPEPYNTLVFLLLIPLLIQAFKFVKDKWGKEPSGTTKEVLALLLSGGFVYVSGGLAGIPLPQPPACTVGVADCIGPVLLFVGAAVAYVAAAWLVVEKVYEKVLKALFEVAGFATRSALTERDLR